MGVCLIVDVAEFGFWIGWYNCLVWFRVLGLGFALLSFLCGLVMRFWV